MDNFYVIKLFNKHTGKRGFVCKQGDSQLISDVFCIQTNQFNTPNEAKKFVKENRLQKNGISVMIVSNEDLIMEGVGRPADKKENLYTAMTLNGDYIFYDTILQKYYFDAKDVGYCIWNDRIQLSEFIDNQMFGFEVLIKQIV